MTTFITGTTGYVGSYVATHHLRESDEKLLLLVRAKSKEAGARRLWKSLQLHMAFDEFEAFLNDRVEIFLGDLTRPGLGLDDDEQDKLIKSMDSVVHIAASLNRKSAKSCFNVNLRGTLHLLTLARAARDHHGLRRFSDVSTVAVSGKRSAELVAEDDMIDWDRSDFDPYARTKKFCETMIEELLPDTSTLVFRPSIVLGDARFPETTQFDMVRAFVFLARLPVLPFRKHWRADIVNADYVGKAISRIHRLEAPKHRTYNLSSGAASQDFRSIVDSLVKAGLRRPLFVPWLEGPFNWLVNSLASSPRSLGIAPFASLMKVFLPYLVYDTVFDNSHVVEELEEAPTPFSEYAFELFRFALDGNFEYPYRAWPGEAGEREDA